MNFETVIGNDEQKIVFLKAIILGINYGRSDNADVYKQNITNEIRKLNEKINSSKKDNGISKDNNIGKNENIEKNSNIEKYENNILNLENQKVYIINSINNLTASNYRYNYSKINLLKSNLINIEKEIEKNKINILKYKEKIKIQTKSENRFKPVNNIDENLMHRTLDKQYGFFSQKSHSNKSFINEKQNGENLQLNHNIIADQALSTSSEENKNLSNELEKTLSSLTNLLS